MRFLAVFCPPIAVLLCGKPIQALINFCLLFLFWVPAVIHAWGIVSDKKADKRTDRIIRANAKINQQ